MTSPGPFSNTLQALRRVQVFLTKTQLAQNGTQRSWRHFTGRVISDHRALACARINPKLMAARPLPAQAAPQTFKTADQLGISHTNTICSAGACANSSRQEMSIGVNSGLPRTNSTPRSIES